MMHKILAFRGCQFGRLGPEDFSKDLKERNTLGSFHGRYHISLKIHSLLRDLLINMLKLEMASGKEMSEGKFADRRTDLRRGRVLLGSCKTLINVCLVR